MVELVVESVQVIVVEDEEAEREGGGEVEEEVEAEVTDVLGELVHEEEEGEDVYR